MFSLLTEMVSAVSVFSQDNMVKSNIDKKFSAHYDAVEAELKSSTVGKYFDVAHKPSCNTTMWMRTA